MLALIRFAAAIATLVFFSFNAAQAEKRVALVIGNSRYVNVPELANPKNDAADITQKLTALGFQTMGGVDLSREGMQQQLRAFANNSVGADVALFFYAGHGVQVEGVNYALPVDSKLASPVDLGFEALSLETVLKTMEQNAKTSILFLDACRDNPMAKDLARSMGTRSSAVGRGLAEIGSGIGSLIAFATQPGNVALDGNGRNSPFTAALLKHLGTSADGISSEMILVRRDVIAATANRQVPWDSSSLTGKVVLGTNAAIDDAAAKARAAEAAEADAWAAIKSTTDVAAIESFLQQHPEGSFANIAKLRLDSLKLALVQPPKVEVVTPPAKITEEPGTPARSLADLFANGLARKVRVGDLPVDSHEKLKLAVSKLGNYEIKVGTFRKNTYIAVLSWSMSWTDAKALAESAGGHLLTITDKQENQFAYDLFKPEERFVFTNEDGKDIMGPLIGLYQPPGSKEPKGGWRWVTDEPFKFSLWTRSQPNNWGGNSNVAAFYSYGTRSPKDEQRPIRWDDFQDEGGAQGFIMELENTQ